MNRETWKMYAHLTRLAFYLYCDEKVTGEKDMTRAQQTANTIFYEYREHIPEREKDFNRFNNSMYTMLDYQYHAGEKRK